MLGKGVHGTGREQAMGILATAGSPKTPLQTQFPCKPKERKLEAEHIRFLLGPGCNFHQAHPEFFQSLGIWDGQFISWPLLPGVTRGGLGRKWLLDHLLCVCYHGCYSNTHCGSKYRQHKKKVIEANEEELLKAYSIHKRSKHMTPLEASKILCNTLLLANQKSSHIGKHTRS